MKQSVPTEENCYNEIKGMFKYEIKELSAEGQEDELQKMEYIFKYISKYPEYDGEEFFPSTKAISYFKHREDRISKCNFTKWEFYHLKILQESIDKLGLEPEPTFEFIVYLWSILQRWIERGHIDSVEEKGKRFFQLLEIHPKDKVKMEVTVGSKHIKFDNRYLIEDIFKTYFNTERDFFGELVRHKKSEIDYVLIKTLLDNLPIIYRVKKTGKYTQAERDFGLSVLWLTGEIIHGKEDDPKLSDTFSNGNFDNMMRTYKDLEIEEIQYDII